MKLPTDKKERNKVLALIGIGAIAALYGLFVGVYRPLADRRGERLKRTEDLNDKIVKARRRVAAIQRDREADRRVLTEILNATVRDRAVLRPRLGNYLLVATEQIEHLARKSGVAIESIREESLRDVPARIGSKADRALRVYTVSVRLSCGMHVLVGWMREIERVNPYAAVARVEIVGQPTNPEKHETTLLLQWPVWVNSDMDTELQGRFEPKNPRGPS